VESQTPVGIQGSKWTGSPQKLVRRRDTGGSSNGKAPIAPAHRTEGRSVSDDGRLPGCRGQSDRELNGVAVVGALSARCDVLVIEESRDYGYGEQVWRSTQIGPKFRCGVLRDSTTSPGTLKSASSSSGPRWHGRRQRLVDLGVATTIHVVSTGSGGQGQIPA